MTIKQVFSRDSHVSVKPEELMCFSEEYKIHRRDMIHFLKTQKGKFISFFIAHIESSGKWGTKKIEGLLKEIDDQGMTVITNNDYYCDYSELVNLNIPFYDLFDRVPMLEKINPFGFNLDKNPDYFLRLNEMKKILKEMVNKDHSIKLFFHWDDFHPKFNAGNFFIEGVIKKVNDEEIEIFSIRSCFYEGKGENKKSIIANEIPGTYFWRFVSPESYLKKIIVTEDLDDEIIV